MISIERNGVGSDHAFRFFSRMLAVTIQRCLEYVPGISATLQSSQETHKVDIVTDRDQRPRGLTWPMQSCTADFDNVAMGTQVHLASKPVLPSKQNASLPIHFPPLGLFLEFPFLTRVKLSTQGSQTPSGSWGELSGLLWVTSSTTSVFIPSPSNLFLFSSWE